MRVNTWKKLVEELRYKDWYMDEKGVYCQTLPFAGVCVKKTGDLVTIWNFGDGTPQADKHGYLDGVVVEVRHVFAIIDMINDVKSSNK